MPYKPTRELLMIALKDGEPKSIRQLSKDIPLLRVCLLDQKDSKS